MQLPDKVSVGVILLIWIVLDIGVVIVDKSDVHALEYLTNQVWIGSVVSKFALIADLIRNNSSQDYESVSLTGWFNSALFLIVGSAQGGVLGAFFLLTWLDSTLLDTMLESQEHTLAEIMIWNHARHVTVAFLHLGLVWSLRHYLSYNARGTHDLELCCCNVYTSFKGFCAVVIIVPLAAGLLHSLLFDDQELYMFGSASIGSKCRLAFGLFAFIAAIYFIFVPLRSVELERKDPHTVTKAVVRVIADPGFGNVAYPAGRFDSNYI